tara:strand:+ start:145 stop:696 length:552 start_codon:yes stop_codon:yes gene_type:complete
LEEHQLFVFCCYNWLTLCFFFFFFIFLFFYISFFFRFSSDEDLANKATAGLQLSFSQLDVQKDLIVAINNMPDAHILSFDFDVLPALHIETTKFVLTSIQLAATIFSLIASATKAFSMLKRKISFNLDKVLLGRDDVPEDVQRRTDYLNETNLMHRHFKKMMKHHGLESKRDSALDDKGKCKN